MQFTRLHKALVPLLLASLCAAIQAASSAASTASDSASVAVSSTSDSLSTSSDSSSKTRRVAAGTYDVVELAAVQGKPGFMRAKLQAQPSPGASAEPAFFLTLPTRAAENGGLAVGQQVLVKQRAYGHEFARSDTQQAFFLVLADDWMQELETRPVLL